MLQAVRLHCVCRFCRAMKKRQGADRESASRLAVFRQYSDRRCESLRKRSQGLEPELFSLDQQLQTFHQNREQQFFSAGKALVDRRSSVPARHEHPIGGSGASSLAQPNRHSAGAFPGNVGFNGTLKVGPERIRLTLTNSI
jgi:hypothetical protein